VYRRCGEVQRISEQFEEVRKGEGGTLRTCRCAARA
jgi:hypothetical protein